MEQTENSTKYIFELNKYKDILTKCQDSKKLKSCFVCEDLISCDIRLNYVKAVYHSMSKGQVGGFEF